MKKIHPALIHIIASLAIIFCIPLHAMNDPLVKFIKTSKSSEKIEHTCPKSDTFSSGDGGGVHTYTYNDVESTTIDFDFLDSAFQMDINGVTVHSNILELLNASLGAGEVHLKFSDNTNVPETWKQEISESWKTNFNGLPRLRIVIDNVGNVQMYGTRETTSTVLEAVSAADGTLFNTINFPIGETNITITNFDEPGGDGISGTITAAETCLGNIGVWAENNSTLYYSAGNVAINTDMLPAGYSFAVKGKMIAEELKVQVFPWADFVFESTYELPTLAEVEQHIKEKGHLQNIPSAKEVTKNGIKIGEMNAKLLQKIEELTLYTIQQQKELQKQQQENKILKARLDKIEVFLLKK